MDQHKPSARKYRFGAGIAVFVIVSFIAGVFFGQLQGKAVGSKVAHVADTPGQVTGRDVPPPYEFKDVDFKGFWDTWKEVKARSVHQPVSDVKMYYGAIAGMVASLGDPYSVYFDPETAQKFTKDLEGTFDGIGAEIGIKNDQLTVIAPLPGTPAAVAGLRAGDKIYGIDGMDTIGMAVENAVNRIRGTKGTKVKLLIGRDGVKAPKEYEITRETITVEPVKWKMVKAGANKHLAVITITHFNEQTTSMFNDAVRSSLMQNPDGIILDLRNNPGGFLDAAVIVAGDWIHKDVIVTEKFSDDTKKNYPSDGIARLADLPTIVLVNGGSASASEIVAGALQDAGKAILVGEKTFGKGSVQDYRELPDGSALKLTVALWLTPKGRSINKEGIAPDVEVKLTPEDFNKDKDPQMDKALELFAAPGGLPKHVDQPKTTAAGNATPGSGELSKP